MKQAKMMWVFASVFGEIGHVYLTDSSLFAHCVLLIGFVIEQIDFANNDQSWCYLELCLADSVKASYI